MNVRTCPNTRLAPGENLSQRGWSLTPLAALVALSLLTLSGCATKEFVEQEMGVVNSRIESLQNLITAAGARIDGNTARLQESDARLGKTEQTATWLGKRIDENLAGLGAANQRLDGLAGDLGKAGSLISANTVELARAHQRLDATEEQVQASRRRVEGTVASLALAEGRLGAAETTLLALSRATPPVAAAPVMAPVETGSATALPVAAPATAAANLGDAYSRLESLAAMVAAATQRVEANTGAIDGVAARLGGLENGLGETRKRTEAGEQALAAAQARIVEVAGRLGATEQGVQAQGAAIAAVEQRVEGAVVAIKAETDRMTRHEVDAAAGSAAFKQLLGNLGQGMDTVIQRVDATDQRIDAGAKAQTETSAQVAALQVAVKDDGEQLTRHVAETVSAAAVVQQTLARLGSGIEGVNKRVDAADQAVVVANQRIDAGAKAQTETSAQVAALQVAVKDDGEQLTRHVAETVSAAALVQQTLAQLGSGIEGVNKRVDAADQAVVVANQRIDAGAKAQTETSAQVAALQVAVKDDGELLTRHVAETVSAAALVQQTLAQLGTGIEGVNKRVDATDQALVAAVERDTQLHAAVTAHTARLEQNEAADVVVSATAREALERAIAAGQLAEGKLVYEAILNEELTNFGLEKAKLSEASKKVLTEFANNLRAGNRNVFIEIQGHTDKTGPAALNMRLGRERAEAVRDFLHKSGGIPLHRLAAVSYGDTQPVADNATRAGRMKNRRVVMVVLK